MRFTSERVCGDIDYASSSTFVNLCRRIKDTHFSRTRKMPLQKLLLTMFNRLGTTLSIELRRFMELSDTNERISTPGYLKQRLKLAPEAIMALCDFHNTGLYRDEDMQDFHGYLLLASDGSGLNVPTTPETLAAYGSSSTKNARQQASLGLSCLYDVINKVILCCSINRVKFNEADQAKAHLEQVSNIIGDRKTIITLDRGYPSLPLFYHFLETGQKFAVRLKSNDYKAERKLMETDDEWVDVKIDTSRLANYIGTDTYDQLLQAGHIRLRIVNVKLSGGAEVIIATNLDESEFNTSDISHIYSLRWGVESAFDMLKNHLQIENFTGTKVVLIEQDIFACIYLCNLIQDMIADAQAIMDSSDEPPKKHKMAINRAYAVGVMKDELVKALLETDKDKKTRIFTTMVSEIQSHVLPVRPDRHYPRKKGVTANKYPNSHKRCY